MRHKHRIPLVALALALAVALVATGCGSGDSEGTGKVRVAVVLSAFNDPFLDAIRKGANAAAKENPRIDLTVEAGRDALDVQDEIAKIESVLATNPDALVVQTNGPDEVKPALERAISDGVKVLLVDNDIPDLEGKTAIVRSANEELGRLAGQRILRDLDGRGELGLLVGAPGITSLENRLTGLKGALAGSGVKIVGENVTDCGQERGVTAMEDLITANPNLDAAIALCGQAGVGAVQAMKGAGLQNGKDLLLYSMDAQPDEAKAILRGDIEASFAERPFTFGKLGVETAYLAGSGKQVKPEQNPPPDVVTTANASEYLQFR